MVDFLTRKQRSKRMASVKGKWTTIETRVHNYLKSRKISHKMHPTMPGNPDIMLKDGNIVVFVDGCFWHGCTRCYKPPSSNVDYWTRKVERNKKNDKMCTKLLRSRGIRVVRLKECKMRSNFQYQMAKLLG